MGRPAKPNGKTQKIPKANLSSKNQLREGSDESIEEYLDKRSLEEETDACEDNPIKLLFGSSETTDEELKDSLLQIYEEMKNLREEVDDMREEVFDLREEVEAIREELDDLKEVAKIILK